MLAWRFVAGVTGLSAKARSSSTVSGGLLPMLSAHELMRGMNRVFPTGIVQLRVKVKPPPCEMTCQEPDVAGLTHMAVNRLLGDEPWVL